MVERTVTHEAVDVVGIPTARKPALLPAIEERRREK